MAGVFQEAGDVDSRARIRSQVWVEYNIIPYTSTSITFPHLCQGYYGHCIVASSNEEMGRLEGGSFVRICGEGGRGQGLGIMFFLCFVLFLCCCWCSFMAAT